MNTRPETVFMVSHTHWDREWYKTRSAFNVLLVRVVGQVLDALETDPAFRHFALDGQAIVLEDYLQAKPGDEERIRRLVRAGRLAVGPWYVLPDEFLVSGEATVRNLLIGHQVGRRFGSVQKVGYLPDTFGHIAQMPQILRRAGIDSFLYTRGNGDEIDELGLEFHWQAPDGSDVLAVHQWDGYCNAGGLGHREIWHAHTRRSLDVDLAVRQVERLLGRMQAHARSPIYLLNNGCDHFPPQAGLAEILEALRAAMPAIEFRHGSFEEFFQALRRTPVDRPRWQGELLGGRHHPILSGVWSARVGLKQRNDDCQVLLTQVAEPLCAYARFVLGRPYPADQLRQAWRRLLENHPHDSICGCSIDPVHSEMESRFDMVAETSGEILRNLLESLAPTFARTEEEDRHTVICAANPGPLPRREVIERLVVLKQTTDAARLALRDESGRTVPLRILRQWRVERFWGIDYRTMLHGSEQLERFQVYLDQFGSRILRPRPDGQTDTFVHLQFLADLPALGHTRFFLEENQGAEARESDESPLDDPVRAGPNFLENRHCKVIVHPDGTFDLEHGPTRRTYRGLNRLSDTEDVGDEYDYAPARRSLTITSEGIKGEIQVVEETGLRASLEVRFVLSLPVAAVRARSGRRRRRVGCPVRMRVGLETGSPVVRVECRLENRAEDHRLRVEFPARIRTDQLVSDGQFLVLRRPVAGPSGADWVQPPPGTFPQQEFSLLEDDRGGLAILNRGLPEVAVIPCVAATGVAEDSSPPPRPEAEPSPRGLAVTLLRAVGWLSRDDFDTRRRRNAGPTIPTPDAQCPGHHRFQYAVVPYEGRWLEAGIADLSSRYRTPSPAVQGVRDRGIPPRSTLLLKGRPEIGVTAVKQHEERDTLVIRLYNRSSEAVPERLTVGFPVQEAWRTDLLEERETEVQVEGGGIVPLTIGPHEIVTLELKPAERTRSGPADVDR